MMDTVSTVEIATLLFFSLFFFFLFLGMCFFPIRPFTSYDSVKNCNVKKPNERKEQKE